MKDLEQMQKTSGRFDGLEPLYTVSQVAQYLGVHTHTIYRYLAA